ncbi:MAG: SUMF1/EgtB/PvdO family nonheme iron enzyme [Planctomycetota bacterium]
MAPSGNEPLGTDDAARGAAGGPREGVVFVSYRRTDAGVARQVHAGLALTLGADAVFLDETIDPGAHWPQVLEDTVAHCAAFVVLVSNAWLKDHDLHGRRRIDDAQDWCRRELEAALHADKHIFPLLLDRAMPPADALPATLQGLTDRNGTDVTRATVTTAVAELARILQPLVRGAATTAPTTSNAANDASILAAYHAWVADTHDRLVSFFPDAGSHRLADRYVQLDVHPRTVHFSTHRVVPDPGPTTLRALMARPIDADSGGAWVILGEPGAGKSTLARHLALTLAQEARDGAATISPVLVPIATTVGPDGAHPFAVAERVMTRQRGQHAAGGLEDALFRIQQGEAPGQVWLLLDGLDEVAPELLGDVQTQLADLARTAATTGLLRIAVFSRPIGYQRVAAPYQTTRLEPLTAAKRRELAEHWLGAATARRFETAMAQRRELLALAGNPLLLTLMARLALERGLPDHRLQLYERSIELLLRTPYDRRAGTIRAPMDVALVLAHLALALQDHPAATWRLEELNDRLWAARKAEPRVAAALSGWNDGDHEAFLRDVERRTGLLAADHATGESWSFLHRQFREFFAARGLVATVGPGQDVVGRLDHKSVGRWSETLGLYCGMVEDPWGVLRGLAKVSPAAAVKALVDVDRQPPQALFDFLWDVPAEMPDWSWSPEQPSRFHWDGDDVARLVSGWVERGRWSRAEAREALWARVSAGRSTVELAWLHFALRALGERDEDAFFKQAGRPRDEVEGAGWVKVPRGSFVMGSPEDERERRDWEGPRHHVTVPAFELFATPVTNAQYARFDRDHTPETFDGRVSNAAVGAHPVVNVDWWEAYLFCAWVGARLPTEAEWEYACRAGTTGPFSFEGALTPEHVNYNGEYPYAEGEKGEYRECTLPAGSLPANGWGLHEMHGNVFEWCQDRWHQNYEDAPEDGSAWELGGSAFRVGRGGSWVAHGAFCRSAYRIRDAAGYRSGSVGVRPARSSP